MLKLWGNGHFACDCPRKKNKDIEGEDYKLLATATIESTDDWFQSKMSTSLSLSGT